MVVEDQHMDWVKNDENFKWLNQGWLPESQLMETREEASAPI